MLIKDQRGDQLRQVFLPYSKFRIDKHFSYQFYKCFQFSNYSSHLYANYDSVNPVDIIYLIYLVFNYSLFVIPCDVMNYSRWVTDVPVIYGHFWNCDMVSRL